MLDLIAQLIALLTRNASLSVISTFKVGNLSYSTVRLLGYRLWPKRGFVKMTASTKVIGFTGPFGSGCTTAAEYLSGEAGFKHIEISEQLHKLWAKRYPAKKETRSGLQALGDKLRKDNGSEFLVKNALRSINAPRLAIEAIRNTGEINYLREHYGYNFTLFGIIPTSEARWVRLKAKYYKHGSNGKMSLKEAQQAFAADTRRDRDEEKEYGQQVSKCIDQADILIDNSETITPTIYQGKILHYLKLVLGEEDRIPSPEEIYMNMAYSACHSSRCMKRHVGAVIVDAGGNFVGMGHNENPSGTTPCIVAYQGCFKDRTKEDYLIQLGQGRGVVFCPRCGDRIDISHGTKVVCSTCFKKGYWETIGDILYPERGLTFCTAIHAEAWALSSAGERARGGELFTTTYPCLQCAEKIIHAGIRKVWYTEPYPDIVSGNRLRLAKIDLQQFEGVRCFDRMFASTRPY
jgi:deoxycytidylate deaminase